MRKCYEARYEIVVLFTADEEAGDDLKRVARKALEEEFDYNGPSMDPDGLGVCVAKHIPALWDADSYVYGTHKGDMLTAEALKLNEVKP